MIQVLIAMPKDAISVPSENSNSMNFSVLHSAEAALNRLGQAPLPDVVLIHSQLAGLSGLSGTQAVRARIGSRPMAVLVDRDALTFARRLLAVGANAVIPSSSTCEQFLAAVTLLSEGARFIILSAQENTSILQQHELLSDRELQVLRGVCKGLQNKEIAHEFQIKEVTVKMHVRAIIHKLGARNRTHAAMIARDLGIV